jgi:hypothetical protein
MTGLGEQKISLESPEEKEASMKKLVTFLLAMFLGACSAAPAGTGIGTPIVITAVESTVIPDGGVTGPTLTPQPPLFVPTELKYRVLEEFPDFFFCDPDYYPIAREDEMVLALQRFPELQSNQDEFQVILNHLGLSATATFTDDQKLAIYREHKKLNAIYFELSGDRYKFQIQTGLEGQQGEIITATIDNNGSIVVSERQEGFPTCPICLAAGTWIDTPRGSVRVEDLRVGDQVWTANEAGERVEGVILQLGRVRAPASHRVIHVTLKDGRELWVSPGHPTADGQSLADLKPGNRLDGVEIAALEYVPYTGTFTYDVLPSGDTGFYWANKILIGSTLAR